MDAQPPAPQHLLIPRPLPQAETFARAVEAEMPGRWASILAPLMQIVPLPVPLDVASGEILIFTSANAVDVAARSLRTNDFRAFCVGAATTRAARAAGFDACQRGDTVAELAASLSGDPPDGPCLHLRGMHTTMDLETALAPHGIRVRNLEIYDQQACVLPPRVLIGLKDGTIAAATLFSPRSARLLFAAAPDIAGSTRLLCLSQAVADALPDGVLNPVEVAARPDSAAMIELLKR